MGEDCIGAFSVLHWEAFGRMCSARSDDSLAQNERAWFFGAGMHCMDKRVLLEYTRFRRWYWSIRVCIVERGGSGEGLASDLVWFEAYLLNCSYLLGWLC